MNLCLGDRLVLNWSQGCKPNQYFLFFFSLMQLKLLLRDDVTYSYFPCI